MNGSWNDLMKERFLKIDALRSGGRNPWPNDQAPGWTNAKARAAASARTPEELAADPIRVDVAGRVMGLRRFGKAAFLVLSDRSGRLQAYLKKDHLGEEAYDLFLKSVDVGDIVWVDGPLFLTRTGELTVEAARFRLLTKAIRPLPEKWHGLSDIETRYRQRYIDLIVNPEVRENFAKRSRIIKAVRDFLESRGFIEVETPMMHQIPGGATARPFRTHHNALDIDLFLRIAPELYLKRLLVGGYERVYELNKNFRNEGISTRHNPEFSMLEFYIAYRDYHFLMSFTEELFAEVAMKAIGTLNIPYGEETVDLTPPWPRIPMLEALEKSGVPADVVKDAEKAKQWARSQKIDIPDGSSLGKILDEIFKEKVEPGLVQPTFIIDHPVELSPLAKRKPDAPGLVERFELFICSREIANAFSELNDPFDQKARFVSQVEAKAAGDDEAHEMDEDFIRALEYGMPPAAGEGIGIDRLVMLLTNSPSIRDVIFFPQLKPEQQ